MPATLTGVARLGTDGNLGTNRYVAEDGGDEFGVGDQRNSSFTTFSAFGRRHGRIFRGGSRCLRYNIWLDGSGGAGTAREGKSGGPTAGVGTGTASSFDIENLKAHYRCYAVIELEVFLDVQWNAWSKTPLARPRQQV